MPDDYLTALLKEAALKADTTFSSFFSVKDSPGIVLIYKVSSSVGLLKIVLINTLFFNMFFNKGFLQFLTPYIMYYVLLLFFR